MRGSLNTGARKGGKLRVSQGGTGVRVMFSEKADMVLWEARAKQEARAKKPALSLNQARRRWIGLVPVLAGVLMAGCGLSSGIVPIGAGVYVLSEMRAPVRGGGAEAHRAVLGEAAGFCQQQGRQLTILALRPDGDPRMREWPTAFDLTFRCA